MANTFTTAIWLGCLAAASAGGPAIPPVVPEEVKLPNMPVATGSFTFSDGMDFDQIQGKLSISQFDFLSVLSRPIAVPGDVMLVPLVQYGLTRLDFDEVSQNFPLGDEDLHSLALNLVALKMDKNSPWFYAGWGRAEIGSDFRHVNSDDFTFDLAALVGYRFSPRFALAAGAGVLNLNGDTLFLAGINFDWIVNDQVRVGVYGPMSLVSYTPNENWSFSLRGFPGGGTWNVTDDNGASRAIDLTSYQVGAFVGRRLTGKLWLNAGLGCTVFNNIQYSDPRGDHTVLDEDMGTGFFGQIGLSIKAW